MKKIESRTDDTTTFKTSPYFILPHITGYIWYQMGISHPALAAAKEKHLRSSASN